MPADRATPAGEREGTEDYWIVQVYRDLDQWSDLYPKWKTEDEAMNHYRWARLEYGEAEGKPRWLRYRVVHRVTRTVEEVVA